MSNYSITQIKSTIGTQKKIKETLKALGLKKIGSTSILPKNPSIEGRINKVAHLIKFEVIK